jgi:hypothetical protein
VGDRLVVGEHSWNGKYQSDHTTRLRALNAGYDRDDPSIAVTRRCGSVTVRIGDLSGMDEVIVRAGRRVLRRTHRKRFRVRPPEGTRRLNVRATDLAGNSSTRNVRLPRC